MKGRFVAVVSVVSILAVSGLGAAALGGCGGPYKGKPEKLPKVKQGKKPEVAVVEEAPVEVKFDTECNAKFTDDPNKAKRSNSNARRFVVSGNDQLTRAGSATEPAAQVTSIVAAIEQYKKALLEDHYNPEATYQLAVAYAQVRKKGCALKMLKRLSELESNPRLAGGPSRLKTFLDQVEDEGAFAPFKNDAMSAIGR
jgi:hypothetical protein